MFIFTIKKVKKNYDFNLHDFSRLVNHNLKNTNHDVETLSLGAILQKFNKHFGPANNLRVYQILSIKMHLLGLLG